MARFFTWPAFVAISTLLSASGGSHSVGVFMEFDSVPGAGLVEIMQKEVDGLLKASGVSLDWRNTVENHGDQAFSRLVVLKFKGSCQAPFATTSAGDFGSAGENRILASSQVSQGQVLSYGEVSCDQIRRVLAYVGSAYNHAARQRALGLAMGRVVAHELYHMLANTTKHAAQGLAKAAHSIEDLISEEDSGFGEADSKAIADALK